MKDAPGKDAKTRTRKQKQEKVKVTTELLLCNLSIILLNIPHLKGNL